MSLTDEYQRQLLRHDYHADPAQAEAVSVLAQLQLDIQQHIRLQRSPLEKIRQTFRLASPPPRGCYMWGDVGRGKTWLMDMFYDTLCREYGIGDACIRMHFHHFMQAIHDQLRLVGQQKNPLQRIAQSYASHYRVICLDEFHVLDITDAMLLYGLLDPLFKHGIVLLATSNQPPDELYRNGLQRQRFLPAIELIKSHTQVLHLDGKDDHRLRLLEKADCWYGTSQNDIDSMMTRFNEMANTAAQRDYTLNINYRSMLAFLHSSDMVWFDFNCICGDQRGAADYIEIAREYHTLFISQIPLMDDSHNDKARRFINLIDEVYDRNVKLLVSAQAQPAELYTGKQLAFEFRRTVSRLEEMRSHEYLQRAHRIN